MKARRKPFSLHSRTPSSKVKAELAALKQKRREIIEESDRKIAEVEAERVARIAEIREKADGWISEIREEAGPPKEIVADEWYHAVYCDACLWPIALLHDVTKGEVQFAGDGVLRVTCPRLECGHLAEYRTDQAVSLQALETGSLPGRRPQG
jgi:hypothetical protein